MNITLELRDEALGETIASDEVPLDSLPPSFQGMDTTLTVGDAQYKVVRGDPETREAIAKAGAVVLTVRKVVAVDPKAILYSVPTLEDVQPSLVVAGSDETPSIRVHEDDWRQVELVHASHRAAVDAELEDIRRVKSEHHKGSGYDAVHVRKRVPNPLDGAKVTLADIESALGTTGRPWGFRGSRAVAGGVAVPDAEAVVLATERDGALTAVSVFGLLDDVVGKLHPVALKHNLLLVNWCATQCLRAHPDGFIV